MESHGSPDVEILNSNISFVVNLCTPERIVSFHRSQWRQMEPISYIDLSTPPNRSRRQLSSRRMTTAATSSDVVIVDEYPTSNARRQSADFISMDHGVIDITNVTEPPRVTQRHRKRIEQLPKTEEITISEIEEPKAKKGNSPTIKPQHDYSFDHALSCPICLDSPLKRDPTVTKCGHVFCRDCIETSLQNNRSCPMCKCRILQRQLIRMYV